MSARLQIVLRCDVRNCSTALSLDTPHRVVARRRANEQGWHCDVVGGNDRCPHHPPGGDQ